MYAMRARHYHHRHCEERKARRSNPCHIGCMDCFVAPLLAMTMVMCLATGGATPALLDTVRPHERVLVPRNDTTEEELQQKKAVYTKYEDYFVIRKSVWRQAGDYAILGVGLPVAIVTDVAMYGAWYAVPIVLFNGCVDFSKYPPPPTYRDFKEERKRK